MSGGEIFLKSRRILAGLLTVLPWMTNTACATSSDVKMPPGFTIKWSIEPKDSVIEQDFVVTEYRTYRFEIVFRAIHTPMSAEEIKQVHKFTGDGSFWIVTKDSVNSDHPEVVIARTPEEVQRRAEGIAKGLYVYKSASPGVIVPVHIRIEQVDSAGVATVHTDEVDDTEGIEGGGPLGIDRLITDVRLRPGKYRLRANTIRESPLPPNTETFLRAAAIPNTKALKHNE